MAKRLNKQMVLGLTIASMAVMTAGMVVLVISLPKKDPGPMAREAAQEAAKGEYEEAAKKYQRAANYAKLRKEMDLFARYMILAGEMALKAGSAIEARGCWNNVMLNDPSNESAQLHIVNFLLDISDFGAAPWSELQKEADRLIAIAPKNHVGLHAKGLALSQQIAAKPENAEESEKLLKEAISLAPSHPKYTERLVQLYMRRAEEAAGDRARMDALLDLARQACEQLVISSEENLRTAESAEASPATAPAEEEAPAKDTLAEAREKLARALVQRGRLSILKAVQMRQQANNLSPTQGAALKSEAATAEAGGLADLKRALEIAEAAQTGIEQALQAAKTSTAPAQSGVPTDLDEALKSAKTTTTDVLVGLARYWQLKQPSGDTDEQRNANVSEFRTESQKAYEKAIGLSPDTFDAYSGLAALYSAQGQLEKALKVLQERLERGYNRKHYLAGVETLRMIDLREQAFRINYNRLAEVARQEMTSDERSKLRQAILDHLSELYNQTVAETAVGEKFPWALFMKGRLQLLEGNLSGAVSTLEEAVKLFQSPPIEVRQVLANLYLQTRAFSPAIELCERIVREQPTNTAAWQMLAEAYRQSYDPTNPAHVGDLAKASTAVREALRYDPNSTQSLATLREIYRTEGNEEGVAAIDRQLNADTPPERLKLREAATLISRAGEDPTKFSQAENILRELLASNPGNADAMLYLGQILDDKYAKAPEADKPAIAAETDKIIADGRTAIKKSLEEASTSTQPAVVREQRQRTADSIERIAIIIDPRLSNDEKAARMEALISTEKDPYQLALQLFEVYRRNENLTQKAAEQAARILAMDLRPDQSGIIEQIFVFATRNKDWALAEKCVIPAGKTGIDPAEGRVYRARLLLARATDETVPDLAKRAADELRTALKAYPRYSMGHAWLGLANVALKQYGDARQAFEEARRIDPRNGMALVGLAMVAEIQGDQNELASLLEACEEIIPQHPWVRSRLAARQEQENPREAIVRREAMRKQNPADLQNLLTLAGLYVRDNNLDEALKIMAECHEARPGDIGIADQYATLLSAKRDLAAIERVIEKTAQSIDQNDTKQKAAVQLMRAGLLANRLATESGVIPPDQRPQVDAAYVEAAAICDKPEVISAIADYFLRTNRLNETVEWRRKLIAAIAASSQQIDDQKQVRLGLIELLLQSRDRRRSAEIQKEINEFRGLFPQDHRHHLIEGRLFSMTGEDSKAIEAFSNYIKAVPDQAIGYAFRGQTHFRASRWEAAIKDLQQVKQLETARPSLAARLLLAKALDISGQPDAAIRELQAIITEDPNNQQAIEELVSIYEAVKRPAATDSLLEARMQADPANPVWPGIRISVATSRGQAVEAVRFAALAAEKSKNALGEYEPSRLSILLRLYLQTGRYDDLLAFIEKLSPTQTNLPLVRLYLASVHAAKQETDKAVEIYLAVLANEDFELNITTSLINSDLASGRLKPDTASAALKKHLDAKPDDFAARLLSLMIKRRQKGDEAVLDDLQEFASSIKIDRPRDKAVVLWLKSQVALITHLNARRYEEARKIYEDMLKLDPDHLLSLNNLAYLLMNDMNDPQAALPYSERAAQLSPNDGSVLDTLGWNHVLLKNYDDAVARLRQAMQIKEDMAAIHYHAAEAFYQRANSEGTRSREEDLESARIEVARAHTLIGDTGQDPEKVMDKIIELGGKLGLSLKKPETMPASAPSR